jgi:hypothetical protein
MSSATRLSSDKARERRKKGLGPEFEATDISKLERELRRLKREAKAKAESSPRKSRSPAKSPKRKSPSPKKSPKRSPQGFLADIRHGIVLRKTSPRKSPKRSPRGLLADIRHGTVLRKTSPKKTSPKAELLNAILSSRRSLKKTKKTSPKKTSPKKTSIEAAMLARRKQLEESPSPISSPFSPPRYSPKRSSPKRSSPKRSSPKRSSPKRSKSPLKISSFFLDDIKKVKLRKAIQEKKEKQASAMEKLFEGRLQQMAASKKKTPSPQLDEDDWA